MKIKICFFAVIFSCSSLAICAQNAFKGSAVLGFTMSQIDGDGLLGYDKLGISTGLKLEYDLSDRMGMGFELLYSQRGSQSGFLGSGDIQRTHIDYIEIPLYGIIKDWYIEDENYYKIKLHFGLSYGYLMNISSANGLYDEDINQFNTSDISWLMGPTYSINSRWSFSARFTRSFTKLFKSNNLVNTDSLVSYFWTLRSEYNF